MVTLEIIDSHFGWSVRAKMGNLSLGFLWGDNWSKNEAIARAVRWKASKNTLKNAVICEELIEGYSLSKIKIKGIQV